MAQAIILSGGNGGDGSDDCNVTANYVVKGKTYIGADTDDEVSSGTLELTGDATSTDVLSGRTFYSTNPHSKVTGTIPTLDGIVFGDSGSTSSFDNSPIVLAASNDHVGAFDYSLHGYFDNDAVRVHIPNLIPGNIKAGVKIGGKNGYIPGNFTNDANATASHILSGYTGYAKGTKVTGNIASMDGQTLAPGNTQKVISCSGKYMTGNITISAVANLIADNIKLGTVVGGVTGTAPVLRWTNTGMETASKTKSFQQDGSSNKISMQYISISDTGFNKIIGAWLIKINDGVYNTMWYADSEWVMVNSNLDYVNQVGATVNGIGVGTSFDLPVGKAGRYHVSLIGY